MNLYIYEYTLDIHHIKRKILSKTNGPLIHFNTITIYEIIIVLCFQQLLRLQQGKSAKFVPLDPINKMPDLLAQRYNQNYPYVTEGDESSI